MSFASPLGRLPGTLATLRKALLKSGPSICCNRYFCHGVRPNGWVRMAKDDQEYRFRMALAGHAYAARSVRIVDRDLRGLSHLVASRQGLFAVNPGDRRLIAHGQYYGIAVHDDAIYVFEACDRPRNRSNRGRIVRLRHQSGRIEEATVLVEALDNGCHQMDIIDGKLHLTDTYNQRLLRISLDGSQIEEMYPLPAPEDSQGYVHVNSLLAFGDQIYLLQHNNSLKTGLKSDIAVFDRAWRRIGTIPLEGEGCHSLAVLEDGTLISCGSIAGEIIGSSGLSIKICNRMTRGLSVDNAQIVVGGSALMEREARDEALGQVYFLDRSYRHQGSVTIPGPVMEIRRLDGLDRSLSTHLARESRR
jgi:hypothetical protein